MRSRTMIFLLVTVAFFAFGCANTRAMNTKLMQLAHAPQEEAEYLVAPPDQLTIEVKGYPEYSRNVIVRPDGKITVPSVGDVHVQGLTMPEVTAKVTEGLTKELAQPNVTVSLVMAASKAVYVLGEVKRPGLQPYYGDMKIVDAIASAQGISFYGDMTQIRLTRESIDGAPTILTVNLKMLINKGAGEENVILREGDIIFVPPTPFAKVGYAFDQILFPFRSMLGGLVTYGGVKSALE